MRLPTIPEIFESAMCLLTGHTWNADGVCEDCGAKK